MRTCLPFAAMLTLAAASLSFAEDAPNPGVESLKTEVGKYGWRVFEAAETVEVYRIESKKSPAGTADTISGYKVTTKGKDQGKEFTARLRQALLEGQPVPDGKEKECEFSPGVAFRFVSGKDHLDLLLCFDCDDLLMSSTDPVAPDARQAMRPFDPYRATMLGFAKEALPEDTALAGLAAWKKEPNAEIAKQTGNRLAKALRAGNKVEVFRIKPEAGDPTAAEKQIEGYPIISQGPDCGPAFANRIAYQMFSRGTTLGPAKGCEFSPGVAFRVTGPEGTAVLLVCFKCDDIKTLASPPDGHNKNQGWVPFERGHAGWLELAKQGLPGDAEIQGMDKK